MNISIIITAYKEEKTIANLLQCIISDYFVESVQNMKLSFEIMLVCPDEETKIAGESVLPQLFSKFTDANINIHNNYQYIKDQKKGKPAALNLAFESARGKYLFLTDGDLQYISANAVINMYQRLSSNSTFGAVTGRPMSADEKNTMLAYWGHLLSDSAHIVRSQKDFFPVSGYIFMMQNFWSNNISHKLPFIPEDILADDAWFSYQIANINLKIGYEPNAICHVKYPTTLQDWYKQKVRSAGGYVQLKDLGVISPSNVTRSFAEEIKLVLYPLSYSKNMREFFWSLALYPARLWLWIKIFMNQKVLKKSFAKTWVRVESTK